MRWRESIKGTAQGDMGQERGVYGMERTKAGGREEDGEDKELGQTLGTQITFGETGEMERIN